MDQDLFKSALSINLDGCMSPPAAALSFTDSFAFILEELGCHLEVALADWFGIIGLMFTTPVCRQCTWGGSARVLSTPWYHLPVPVHFSDYLCCVTKSVHTSPPFLSVYKIIGGYFKFIEEKHICMYVWVFIQLFIQQVP